MSADAAVALALLVVGWTLIGVSLRLVARWDARRRRRLDRDVLADVRSRVPAGGRRWL